MARTQKSPVANCRRRIKREGFARVEVLVRKEDAAVVRALVEALADPARRKNALQSVKAIAAPSKPDFKEFLMSAPLEGIELTRDRDMGRDVEL